ncbi:MAG: TlyA family RNA methyltransferase [Firmicutes bacterium]|nr:TlyA family RNA methyltransferase [Bacillota bacterium]
MEPKIEKKKRLDLLLVDKGLVSTRSRARGEIMAGNVYVDGKKQDKAGLLFSSEARIELRASCNPYVSRGGMKLEKALQQFNINLQGKIVLDIGASTGGFTHCCLEHGAKKVYALDVGYGQLDWSLRNDDRVINMERTNARLIKKEDFPIIPDLVTIDVSFISLTLILPAIAAFPVREIICLIKPQFEATPGQVRKKGVVKDPLVHKEILYKVLTFALKLSYRIAGLTYSPLKGPKGNIEYLLYLTNFENDQEIKKDELESRISTVVSLAFHDLWGRKEKEGGKKKC